MQIGSPAPPPHEKWSMMPMQSRVRSPSSFWAGLTWVYSGDSALNGVNTEILYSSASLVGSVPRSRPLNAVR